MNSVPSIDRLIVRCPYCIVGTEFRLMSTYKTAQFVCLDCSHQERPEEARYRCSCPHCLKLTMGLSSISLAARGLSANQV